MQKAGINTVRIAESTWRICEPQEGVFDFSHARAIIRDVMKLTAHRKCVIGFQIDNETKYYGTFEKFQRTLVDEFLSWQADIVNEYAERTS